MRTNCFYAASGLWESFFCCSRSRRKKRDWIALGIAAVFTLAALLPYAGFDLLSDMGMQYINIEACVYQVPSMAVMTREVILAMIWWAAALLFTLPFYGACQKAHHADARLSCGNRE